MTTHAADWPGVWPPVSQQRQLAVAHNPWLSPTVIAPTGGNSRSCLLYAVARPSVVCNACAPYSGGCNFPQFFYGIWYLGHPLTCTENFMEIVPGEILRC